MDFQEAPGDRCLFSVNKKRKAYMYYARIKKYC